jgi:WD40 repeat protein
MSQMSRLQESDSLTKSAGPPRANPYIGPRPFAADDAAYFFGREFEARELAALLSAERLVLLYSPSGAGKTSLIQARLVRAMQKQRFEVLPIIRLCRQAAPGESPLSAGGNRYVEAVVRSLGLAEPRSNGRLDLRAYLRARPLDPEAKAAVLIFDQFEEVFTLDPADLEAKQEFFRQLGEALGKKDEAEHGEPFDDLPYWALFALREDYLGALDPYLGRLPSRFTTFRINHLDEKKTLAAVQGPADRAGVKVSDGAARWVFQRLRRRQVLRPGRQEPEEIESPYVDGLQLQVVCQRLWDQLPAGKKSVGEEDLEGIQGRAGLDQVNSALADFYAEAVHKAALESRGRIRERDLRLWIDQNLITQSGMRGQVVYDPRALDLPAEAVQTLMDSSILRCEERGGTYWLELTHDRLVKPARLNNDAWFRENLKLHQIAAVAWDKAGRPSSRLLSGKDLTRAVEWSKQSPQEMSDLDREFLKESVDKRRRGRLSLAVLAAVVLLAVAVVAVGVFGFAQRRRAAALQANYNAARANYLAARAAVVAERNLEAALIYARDALLRDTEAREALERLGLEQPEEIAPKVAKQVLARSGGRTLRGHSGPVIKVAMTDQWVITASRDGTARLWEVSAVAGRQTAVGPARVLSGHGKPILWFDLNQKNDRLATVGVDRKLRVWSLDPRLLAESSDPNERIEEKALCFASMTVEGSLSRVAFFEAPAGPGEKDRATWVCAGGQNGTLYFWRVPEGKERRGRGANGNEDVMPDLIVTDAYRGRLSAIEFNADLPFSETGPARRGVLATSSEGGDIRLWPVDELVKKLHERKKPGPSPSGETLSARELSYPFPAPQPKSVLDLEFFKHARKDDRDELWLASSCNDKDNQAVVRLWRVTDLTRGELGKPAEGTDLCRELRGHEHQIVDLAIDDSDSLLVVGDLDGRVYFWRLADIMNEFSQPGKHVRSLSVETDGRFVTRSGLDQSTITDIAIANVRKGKDTVIYVAASATDGTVTLWEAPHFDSPKHTLRLDSSVSSVAFGAPGGDAEGLLLFSGCDDELAKAWRVSDLDWEQKLLKLDLFRRPPQDQFVCPLDEPPLTREGYLGGLNRIELRNLCDEVLRRKLSNEGRRALLKWVREQEDLASDADLLEKRLLLDPEGKRPAR